MTSESIRLMGLKIRKRKVVQTLSDGVHQLVRPERGCLGTQGYLINRAGMRKVLDCAAPSSSRSTNSTTIWEIDLHLYGVEPHLIWESGGASSIVKSNVAKARVATWLYWLHPVGKFFRSVNRHWYLWRHRSAFYPAQRPAGKPGR